MNFFNPLTPIRDLSGRLEVLIKGKLWAQVLIGLWLGMIVGVLLGPDIQLLEKETTEWVVEWLAMPGYLFLRLIKMILIPLVVASIIRGLGANNDKDLLKRLGKKIFVFITITTTIAVFIGMSLAFLIKPGTYVKLPQEIGVASVPAAETIPVQGSFIQQLPQLLIEIIPDNPLEAMINGEMLAIVIFSLIAGIAFALQPKNKADRILSLLDGVLSVCMTIVRWAMFLAPWAVFGLIAKMASQVGIATLVGMSVYVATVTLGLALLIIGYYLCVFLFTSHSLKSFVTGIAPLQLLAFSTSSSAAVMPMSIETIEEKFGVESEIAELVIPLGVTMNMAGTAVYQGIAVIFLTQMSGIELSVTQLILVVFALVASSIGAPGTPGLGGVILASIAASFGIPTTGIVLIIGVDRLLDMGRTVVNVTGDQAMCLVLAEPEEQNGFFHRMKTRFSSPPTVPPILVQPKT